MADDTVDQSCGCCLRRAPFEDVNTEMYWRMLKDCFNIQVARACKDCGICQECVSRLVHANNFKLQVQRSQLQLQERLGRTLQSINECFAPKDHIETAGGSTNVDPLGPSEFVKIDIVIKKEPEEVSFTGDHSTGLHDEVQPPSEAPATDLYDDRNLALGLVHHGEHFMLSREGASTSTCENPDATSTEDSESQPGTKRKHRCKICGKQFTFPGSLRRHMRLHTGEKLYSCEVCDKTFSQSCHLQEHKHIHTGVKPYTCEKCNKKFTHKNSLTQHLKLHGARERPFVCEVCNKDFARLGALKTHERIHTGEKPYACDICYKAFTLPEGLRRHKFTHTNEKPFVCETCQKRFADTGDLKRHVRIHTGEKPYSCNTCDKKFAQVSNLKQHTLTHTGDKRHVCEVCQRRFTKSSHLKVHRKQHSGVIDVTPAVMCKVECNLNEHGS